MAGTKDLEFHEAANIFPLDEEHLDEFLDMLEFVYNFGRKQLVGLKAAAMMALRGRNVAKKKRGDADEAA